DHQDRPRPRTRHHPRPGPRLQLSRGVAPHPRLTDAQGGTGSPSRPAPFGSTRRFLTGPDAAGRLALPVCRNGNAVRRGTERRRIIGVWSTPRTVNSGTRATPSTTASGAASRSEEHTSELQSRENLVCRLLL